MWLKHTGNITWGIVEHPVVDMSRDKWNISLFSLCIVIFTLLGSLRIDDFCTTPPLDCVRCSLRMRFWALPASGQSRRRWWERFAGVLETGGREVSFQSFPSILRVFLPDNLSITLGAYPWCLILILFDCFRSRNDLLQCHGERYEFNQHWKRSKHDTVCSPAVKGQNCSFFDKSIKLGRVTNLYKTNISWYGAMPNFLPEAWNARVKNMTYKALTWKRG